MVGAAFVEFGVVSIALSVYFSSQILAFIGLGLTFWGVLFILTAPKRYVRSDLVISGVYPEYSSIDRVAKYLGNVEKAYYIPSYPSGADIPEHLMGFKDPVVFVSAEAEFQTLPIEDIFEGKFMPSKYKGALLTPPGLGLLKLVENNAKINLRGVTIEEMCEILPRIFLEDFALAKDLTMSVESENVHLTVNDSIYRSLYISENGSNSVKFLGCPIASAVACLLAQATGKTVTITETTASPDGLTVETDYRIVGGRE
jgi:hypothetical protein